MIYPFLPVCKSFGTLHHKDTDKDKDTRDVDSEVSAKIGLFWQRDSLIPSKHAKQKSLLKKGRLGRGRKKKGLA